MSASARFFASRFLAVTVFYALQGQAALVNANTFEMQVVEVSGQALDDPANNLTINAGDQFRVEFYLDDATMTQIGGYQIVLALGGEGLSTILPAQIPCTTDADCGNAGTLACGDNGVCPCISAATIDESRPDYLFLNKVTISASSCASADTFAFGSLIFGPGLDGYPGRAYLGEILLTVPPGPPASNTVSFDLNPMLPTVLLNPINMALPINASATIGIEVVERPVCGNGVIEPGEDCDPPDAQCCTDACMTDSQCVESVPTASAWGLFVLALLLLTYAKLHMHANESLA